MSVELAAAAIGAGAAISAQLVAALIQYFLKRAEISAMNRRTFLDASKEFEQQRLAALRNIYETLSLLLDGEVDAIEAYTSVRPFWFYVSADLERNIRSAVRSASKGDKLPKDDVGSEFADVFRMIEQENQTNLRSYYE